ncbi:RNA-directed DNA polymerase, eukaryota [Tanacetum coccineum]
MEVLAALRNIDHIHSMDLAQKAKIKWSIEGDENSNFFHGILNKKRNQMNIRGITIDAFEGAPTDVKHRFLSHFQDRFVNLERRANIDVRFRKLFLKIKFRNLEREVLNRRLKTAVGAVAQGTNPGPDEFAFGFYRHFLDLLLSTMLVNVLGDIVNEVQSAFIAERQMLDGPFILNEILQWCTKKKKKTLIFKVDFEKAFDSIRWDFLDDNEFQFYKGLKQGDPLSPFLFILVMESLHLSFQRIVNAGMFKGIVLDQSLCLSHMFYADDAIFLGEWSDGNISTLIHVLKCFFHASGLKINLNKSKIMGINVESAQVIQAAAKLGCLVLKCPFYYLGTRWGFYACSSLARIVEQVLHILESIRSHFFNGHDPGSKKASWVKWNNVLTDKKRGGLGVSSLFALNRGLMIKWVWKFLSQKDSLWTKVIVAIHGVGGKIHSEWTSIGKSCWLSILSEVRSLQRKRLYALESSKDVTVSSKIGDTSLVRSFRQNSSKFGIRERRCISVGSASVDVSMRYAFRILEKKLDG